MPTTTGSRLTVVTNVRHTDPGPAVAQIAATGVPVADGLAVRVVDPDRGYEWRCTSWSGGGTAPPALRHLPSAWGNPDTNLAVIWNGIPGVGLHDDIAVLAAVGYDPSHRLTVQSKRSVLVRGYTFPLPIEPGDVGIHARDNVLRTGGHVLIEAPTEMTAHETLAVVGLPPWADWIGQLDVWVVVSAHAYTGDAPDNHITHFTDDVVDAVQRLAGGRPGPRSNVRVHVAVNHLPRLPGFAGFAGQTDVLASDKALVGLLDDVDVALRRRVGTQISLVHTGADAAQSWMNLR